MIDKYDVIIIGAGISGLICGTMLAKNGKRVLIMERNDKAGGCVTSRRKRGFNFDYGAHLIGSCNDRGIFGYYLRSLGIKNVKVARLDPTDRFVFPDMEVEVPQGLDEYRDLLQSLFPDEAAGLRLFFKEVERIARRHSSAAALKAYDGVTYEDILRRFFKSERIMSVLSAQVRYVGRGPRYVAATAMCLMIISYIRDGTYYPIGGTQYFIDTVADAFRSYGGELLLRTEAVKIETHGGRADTVHSRGGERFRSDNVVIACDMTKVNASSAKDDAAYWDWSRRIGYLRAGGSCVMVYLGVGGDLDVRGRAGWYHSSYKLNSGPKESWYMFVPTLIDPSLAPEGKHVIELAMPFPYEVGAITNWSRCKAELRDELVARADSVIPGLRNAIEYEESATPKTIERFTNNKNGSMYGWEMSADQVVGGRPGSRTPIDGLYCAGHWTNPGCGVVSAATSGWITGLNILNVKATANV